MSGLRMLRFGAALTTLLSVTLFSAGPAFAAPPESAAKGKGQPGVFDYYILSMVWTPEECARQGKKADPVRCVGDRRAGFLVRGLWPEFESGRRPQDCAKVDAVPPEMLEAIRPIMTDDAAIQQLWRRHGSCAGLSVDFYFADMRVAFERIKLPEMFKNPIGTFSLPAIEAVNRIADANPELPPASIAGVCEKKKLTEVRICVTKDLDPRTCGPNVTANCSDKDSLFAP